MSTAPTNLTPETLASTIRQKYPGKYTNKSDVELSQAWLKKYPTYWKNVDAGKFAAKGMWQPTSTATKTESTGKTGEESAGGKFLEGVVENASPIAATVGSVAGGMVAGPPGAVAGATYGGMVGEGFKRDVTGQPHSAGAEVGAGVTQGALEYVGGQLVPKMLAKAGAKAAPKIMKTLNNYIGLKASDLPKWGRTAEEADKVAKVVLDEAGVKKTLPAQRDAIEAARKAHDVATEKLVQAPGGRVTDFHSVATDRAVKLLDEVEKEGVPQEQLNAIDKNLDGITKNLKAQMSPSDLLEAKRGISNQITTWDRNTTNIRQRFLQGLYDDINEAIKNALPAKEAGEFADHNRAQTLLITAREAAKEKILAQQLKPSTGLATRAIRTVGGGIAGAASGAVLSGESGHDRETGAIVGGLIGAGVGTYGKRLSASEMPALDVKAQQAIQKYAPKLSKAARGIPVVARALQAIQSTPGSNP